METIIKNDLARVLYENIDEKCKIFLTTGVGLTGYISQASNSLVTIDDDKGSTLINPAEIVTVMILSGNR